MKLTDYLNKHGVTHKQLAGRIPCSEGLVWQWIVGRQRITAERAIDIERATDGHVSRNDLRPDVFSAPVVEVNRSAAA